MIFGFPGPGRDRMPQMPDQGVSCRSCRVVVRCVAVVGRGELTDKVRAAIEPLLRWRARGGPVAGSPSGDQRDLVEAVDGAPWRDQPERYGPWKTCHNRLRCWSANGTWDRVEAGVAAGQGLTLRVAGDACGMVVKSARRPTAGGATAHDRRRPAQSGGLGWG